MKTQPITYAALLNITCLFNQEAFAFTVVDRWGVAIMHTNDFSAVGSFLKKRPHLMLKHDTIVIFRGRS